MRRHATDARVPAQESAASPSLPADHVLNSGAVLFPGAFDQHGCHLVLFPVDQQARLSSEFSKAEVVDFINYFQSLHNKKQEKQSLVSVVADLRDASLPATRFIAETVLLLEQQKRTVHSVYAIQPRKKDAVKALMKLLAPSKSHTASFKRVFLRDLSELSNYIDRSQLTASLGGYFIYSHQSWVTFVKEIDAFVQEFLSVVQRLPLSISTLKALSRLPLPSTFSELQHFCSTNQAKFQQLRRELGLDNLLRHCESAVKKLRHPEMDPCYQAMAGTVLFTHTAFDMLNNHSRITAAVEKVELLWQQAFSKARLQLQVFQLRQDALQITEQIETLLQKKLQPYQIEIAKDAAKAEVLVFQFETSIHTPAMALVRCAEDVIHTLVDILTFEGQSKERWVLDLERLKKKLHSAVHFILQTLRAVSSYHHYYNKASKWYTVVLCEDFLQEMLSGVNADRVSTHRQWMNGGSIPAWRRKLSSFLKKNPPPSMEELFHLDHLANVIPDDDVQQTGKRMSQRCMTLRKLVISSGPIAVGQLQLALRWQYELLRSNHGSPTSAHSATSRNGRDVQDGLSESILTKCESSKEADSFVEASPSTAAPGIPSADGKPSSLSSFDSGFDGAGSTQLEAWGGRERAVLSRLAGTKDCSVSGFSVSEDHGEQSSLEDTSKIFSSTIVSGTSLVWDSFDLHQHQDSVEGEISLKDWHVKEQESLREVEKILDRADEILEEEENVLAQEAVLEALLGSVDGNNHWPTWHHENQHSVMSSSELNEAGVLCLEDEPDSGPVISDNLSEPSFAGALSETSEEDCCSSDTLTDADTLESRDRPDLLAELKNIHVLDELIIEESLKIHELRLCRENSNELSGSQLSCTNGALDTSKEREAFRLHIEKEKIEVEKLERSLQKDCTKDRATKVVSCSIMEAAKTESQEDQALYEELFSDSWNKSQNTHTKYLDQNYDACLTENIQAELCADVAKGTTPHNQDLINPEADSVNGTGGIQPQGSIYEREFDGSCENATVHKPEASLTPETGPDDGGGKPLFPPKPKPRKTSLHGNNLAQHDDPGLASAAQDLGVLHSDLHDEACDDLPETPAISHKVVLNPNVEEHSSNNNNNNHQEICEVFSEVTTKSKDDTAVVPAELLQIQTSPAAACPHRQPPDQPLEFDPGGREEQNDDLPHGGETSVTMRVSGWVSPGVQTQLSTNMTELSDFKTPIVLDTGSGLMKAGFADQDLPNVLFPTIIGMPKYEEIMNGNIERETYIGHEAQHMRGVLTLKHPIKNGIVNNWDDMEKIWHHTFQQLCVDPEDHPVLLTEAAMNPLENRQRMVEIMFECFGVPLTYVAMQAVLALYAAGRSTGVVFDSGDGVSHSVPVFEGYCLPHAVQRFPLAGADVTAHLKKLLQEQGVSMRTTAEMEIVREMKEKCCCVAFDYEAELTQVGQSLKEMHYTMPDGQIVTLSTERFRAPEILFKPELIGRDHCGMHQSVFKSILSSDIDLRRCFLGNIVLSGGNTLLSGLPERLQAEIKNLLPADMRETVHVTSPTDRDFSVWSGGAVLASLPTFSSAWIIREEYEEYGPQIVFRKCF